MVVENRTGERWMLLWSEGSHAGRSRWAVFIDAFAGHYAFIMDEEVGERFKVVKW